MKKEEVKEKKNTTAKGNSTKKENKEVKTKKHVDDDKVQVKKKKVVKNEEEKQSKKKIVVNNDLEDLEREDSLEENDSDDQVIIKEILKDEPSKKTKKRSIKVSDIGLVLGLVIVVVLGFLLMQGEKVSYDLPLPLSGDAGLHQLTYQEYQEKIDNGDAFVVILERATCSHCVTYMPIAKDFAEENKVPMYYVDTDTFTEDDWETFETSNTFLKKSKGSWGTPTTVVLLGEEAIHYIEGSTTEKNLLELYNEYFEMPSESE